MQISASYRQNPFHNFEHACHVTLCARYVPFESGIEISLMTPKKRKKEKNLMAKLLSPQQILETNCVSGPKRRGASQTQRQQKGGVSASCVHEWNQFGPHYDFRHCLFRDHP